VRTNPTRSDAEQHRDAVVALIADFRSHATTLVEALRTVSTPSTHDGELCEFYNEDWEWEPEVTALGRTWNVWLHDPHGDFEAPDGTLVVAHLYRPDLLDAWFLEQFARTSGRHPAVLTAPTDLYHLLDAAVPDWQRFGVVALDPDATSDEDFDR